MPASQGRQPRFRFSVGGRTLRVSSGTIDLNRYAEAGTYEVQCPLAATEMTLADLTAIGKTDVSIQGSNDGDTGYRTIMTGVLDRINVRASAQPGQGGVMAIFRGRDLTARLIDTLRTKKTLNTPSSGIVRDLAARHGLKVEIDETPGDAGQMTTQDFAHLIDNDSDWNTIAALAEKEGAYLYIAGDTLYFKQAGNDAGLGSYSVNFTPPVNDAPAAGNIIDIDLIENVHLAGGVTATVQSFRTYEERTASSTQKGDGEDGAEPLQMTEQPPGLTDSQVDAMANKNQISAERHEMQVDVLMVGDVNIDIRQMLTLSGTSSAWDQSYFMDTIHHDFSVMGGYTMRIEAKNKKGG